MLLILKPPPSSLLPPHTLPLGRPSGPAPSIQYRASNLDWQLASYMILYMFQCHSPKSPHPLPLPQIKKYVKETEIIFMLAYTKCVIMMKIFLLNLQEYGKALCIYLFLDVIFIP